MRPPLAPARPASGPRSVARLALVASFALLTGGCAAAWRPLHPGRFDLTVPDGWDVTRNRRAFGEDFFLLSDPAHRATIGITLVHAPPASRALPLDLLAEVRVLSQGRSAGVETGRTHLDQLDVDGHEAWAVTGRRRWHFVTADFSAVVARVGPRLAVITLEAPTGHLDDAAAGWSVVLDSLRFPTDPVPADAPIFEPDG